MLPLISLGLAAASSIPEIAKLIASAKQAKLADQLGATPRPTYTIPGAQAEAVANARNMADNRTLPGQQTMEDKLGANTANAAQMATQKGNPADILATISALNGNQNDAQNSINTNAVSYQDQNRDKLNTQLGQQAAYQDKAFQINQMEPYNNAMKASSALKNASMLNEQSGITGLASDASMGLSSAIPSTGINQTDTMLSKYGYTPDQLNGMTPAQKSLLLYSHANGATPTVTK